MRSSFRRSPKRSRAVTPAEVAKLAIICPPLPGHINPMAALARELTRRGHSITFLGVPDFRSKLSADLAFSVFGEDEHPPGSLPPFLARLSRLGRFLGLRPLITDLAAFAETSCRRLPAALEQLRPDALIIDQTDIAASLVSRAVGVPFVNVANALPLNEEAGVPPPFLPWAYDPSPYGIRRNVGAYQVASLIEAPIRRVIRRHARRFGLPYIRYGNETWSDLCQLTQCVRGLDYPRQQLPATFHYVGPLREREPLGFELPASGRQLLFCSLGSLQGSRRRLLHRIARAAADLDLDLLIAHGGLLSDEDARTLPGSPLVRDFVPQRAVLARSAVAISHAGFNTVMDSLSCAVPVVALPITFEQPGTAARLARTGAGVALHRRRTSGRIRRAVAKVLSDDTYRSNVARLAAEIALAGGVSRAADLIEQSCGLRALLAGATKAPQASDDARGDIRSEST